MSNIKKVCQKYLQNILIELICLWEGIDMEELNSEKKQKDSNSKFCKHCGEIIPKEAIICTKCGCQVEEIQNSSQPQVVINNTNTNTNTNTNVNSIPVNLRMKNKWTAFFLCLFLGLIGVHKFYEGKILMGVIYLFTGGLCGIGWIIDLIILIGKPNPYYV